MFDKGKVLSSVNTILVGDTSLRWQEAALFLSFGCYNCLEGNEKLVLMWLADMNMLMASHSCFLHIFTDVHVLLIFIIFTIFIIYFFYNIYITLLSQFGRTWCIQANRIPIVFFYLHCYFFPNTLLRWRFLVYSTSSSFSLSGMGNVLAHAQMQNVNL